MASSIPLQIAETIQTAHINRSPSPRRDLNPSTAASRREQVVLEEKGRGEVDVDVEVEVDIEIDDDDDELDDDDDDESESEIPVSVLRAPPRRQQPFPPLPDLRFEQSYLHSIAGAETYWKVAWITARDQVFMPFTQGMVYNLALLGWQTWNRNAVLNGNSLGAKLRRWWYGVNNWPIPPQRGEGGKAMAQ